MRQKDFSNLDLIELPTYKNGMIKIADKKRKIQFKLLGNVLLEHFYSNEPMTIFTITYSKICNELHFTNLVFNIADDFSINNLNLIRKRLNELNIGYEEKFEEFISIITFFKITKGNIL